MVSLAPDGQAVALDGIHLPGRCIIELAAVAAGDAPRPGETDPGIVEGGEQRAQEVAGGLQRGVEQDDHCANVYHKSLLYLVSHAFEDKPRIPLFRDGVPILGMEKFLRKDAELMALFKGENADLVISPNSKPVNSIDASTALHHGDFDDDGATVKATLRRILGDGVPKSGSISFQRSASSLRDSRVRADKAAGF